MSPEYVSSNTQQPKTKPILWIILLMLIGVTVGGFAVARNQEQPKDEKVTDTEKKDGESEKKADEEIAEKKEKEPVNPFPNTIKAPSLEGGSEWLNVGGEISLKDLRGKVVLLDFWTYCCINCLHVLPDLKYLEKKYSKELVVIGVHSAKFDNEKDSDNIRKAILRYEVEHPVINDSKMTVWQKFGARAWPTVVLLDPEGNYCGYLSGEGNREILDEIIGKVVEFHKFKGTLDETPFKFDLERHKMKPTPLKFPGKILADEKNDRLFISDSNHNRIVVSSLDGKLQSVIGSGEIGFENGSYEEATFDHPQGMALVENTLYVADTENHSIRAIDLEKKTVSTLSGTGKQGGRVLGGPLKTTALNSPWALHEHQGVLYIAMAGPHQMWSHKLGSDRIEVYAGSGREDIIDGPLDTAAMAQPSGIAADDKFMYVCDSEGSSIRKIPFDPKGEMTTVVGPANLPRGRSLFEFGDVDDVGEDARLQHPLGIIHHEGTLYVADTYNHKIKKIDLKTRTSKTWLGTSESGTKLDPPQFYEPSGLAIAKGNLYIADTNNHRLLRLDLKTGKQISKLTIAGLKPPERKEATTEIPKLSTDASKVKLTQAKAGESLKIEVTLELPEGFKLNKLLPMTYVLSANEGQTVVAADQLNKRKPAKAGEKQTVTLSIPLTKTTGKAELQLSLAYGYCNEGTGGLCKLNRSQWVIPIETTDKPIVKAEKQQLRLKSVAK